MTNLTDDIEALLESEEKVVRAREAAEDSKKKKEQQRGGNSRGYLDDKYRVDREENDKRRARKSHDYDDDEPMEYYAEPVMAESVAHAPSDEGSANGSDRNSRGTHSKRSPNSRGPPRSSYSPQAPPRHATGDYYDGGGRPSRIDEYRPGSRGGRGRNSPPNGRRSPGDRRRSRSPRGHGRESNRRDRSPPRNRRDDRRRPPPPPEPTDDERDRRTVFVQQLAVRLRTKELSRFFEAAGEVVEAQIVKDRISGRSKGYVVTTA